jgi:predicted Zn-dependent peptidase
MNALAPKKLVPTALLLAALFGVIAPGAALATEETPLPEGLPPFAEDKPLPEPEIVEKTLDNGLTVWIVPRPGLPKVTAQLVVRGGTATDPADGIGISEVLAETVKAGTESRTSKQIAEQVQAVGGDLSASVNDDAFLVTADALSTGLPTVIGLLADVAAHATFPPDEVELAKVNALQSLQANQSTPEFEVEKAFGKAVFGDHPYHVVAPEAAALAAITPELLRGEYARRFHPERALLLVVGAVDPAAATAEIEKAFGSWKGTAEAPPPVAEAPERTEHRILLVGRPGAVQSEIRVGSPTLTSGHPDYFPLLVANTVFGGSFGSRLTENIREDKGYTYSPGSGVSPARRGGTLRVRAAVRNEVTAATLLEIFYEMDRMAATLPNDEELSRAKRFQTGLYLLRNQLQGAMTTTLANYWVRDLPPAAVAQFVPNVEAVTAEQVQQAGRKYLVSRDQVVVVGGDVDHVRPQLEIFGPVTVLEP